MIHTFLNILLKIVSFAFHVVLNNIVFRLDIVDDIVDIE